MSKRPRESSLDENMEGQPVEKKQKLQTNNAEAGSRACELDSLSALSKSLESLLHEEKSADVVFPLESMQLAAHSLILSIRSPFLARLIQTSRERASRGPGLMPLPISLEGTAAADLNSVSV